MAPEHYEELVALSAATLEKTLKEPGCIALYQTSKQSDPWTLIFFEVFRTEADHQIHLEAEYTKAFFAGVEGKLAGTPKMTRLQEL